ncbi:hypothetical protein HKX42_06840 [Salinisphaera sp. USBA-960]|nr:hypothetical protein [Salifodinibacter halophilus]NNC26589.1 hypothetical protein [Salifodinibacter halophilus]
MSPSFPIANVESTQELAGHDQQIIEAEPKKLANGDQHFLLLGGERGQQVVARVGSIMDIASERQRRMVEPDTPY